MINRATFPDIAQQLKECRICFDTPFYLPPLPHKPNPLFQGSVTARLCIAGQAPGIRAHEHCKTFTDPSGDRLRQWLGLDDETFYNPEK